MADLYASYAALAAAETEGVDYARIAVTPAGATLASIAIHGGGIEAGSGEMARYIADGGKRFAYYEFAGIKPSNNVDLHLTSTVFDEPIGVALVAASTRTLSMHGYTGTTGVAETSVGGLDGPLKDWVIRSLRAAGFGVITAPSEIAGTDPANICSRNAAGGGVQLEMSRTLRESFFPGSTTSRAVRDSGQRTATFYAYADALISIASLPATSASAVDVWDPAIVPL
jgi:phage replication-related protein YjqB (UPF0714/DUF867 family)